ncbi:hypothetical protein TNCV_4918261 [Trichonephila clavipes]|nr:hypothetical protein TNCV_4918261 [Trichonephila clavipes]
MRDLKLVFAENEIGVSDFRLKLYKWSGDSRLLDEKQLLYLILVYQLQRCRSFILGLDCVHFVDQHHVCLRYVMCHEENDLKAERFCDPAFVDQKTECDTFVKQLCRYLSHTCNSCRHT